MRTSTRIRAYRHVVARGEGADRPAVPNGQYRRGGSAHSGFDGVVDLDRRTPSEDRGMSVTIALTRPTAMIGGGRRESSARNALSATNSGV